MQTGLIMVNEIEIHVDVVNTQIFKDFHGKERFLIVTITCHIIYANRYMEIK